MKRSILFIGVLMALCFAVDSLAQGIKLKDLKKVELISIQGDRNDNYKHVEIVSNNGKWRSYRTKLYQTTYITDGKVRSADSTRVLLGLVADKQLIQLLTAVNQPDTIINASRFNIKATELYCYADSLNAVLNEQQKFELRDKFSSTAAVKKMLVKAINSPPLGPWRSYNIIITTKSNKTFTLKAEVGDELYHLPWVGTNKVNNYNPDIAELFETISGDKHYVRTERNRLLDKVAQKAFKTYIETDYNWDRFKKEKPDNYAGLSKTLYPAMLSQVRPFLSGFLVSSKLPSFLQMYFNYEFADTINTAVYNAYEKVLIERNTQDNFLFRYLAHRPTLSTRFHPYRFGANSLEDVKKYYPDIEKYDYREILYFYVTEPVSEKEMYNDSSTWLLLPDSKLILLSYAGYANDRYLDEFTGILPAKRRQRVQACMVFDSTGKRIGGANVAQRIRTAD